MPSLPVLSPAEVASRRLAGFLFAVSAALVWSGAGVGVKLLPLGPLAITGYRSLFALPILLIALFLRSEQVRDPAFYRFALRQPLLFAGALSYAFCVTLFVTATKLTMAANAILFQYSAPIYVALLSWPLLGERVRGADWLAVLGCLLGMAWCFADKLSQSGWIGNVVALLSGLGFGLLPLIWRRMQQMAEERDPHGFRWQLPQLTLVLGNAVTCVLALPWMLREVPQSGAVWIGLALLGMVQISVAYLLYAAAVRRLRAVESLLAATLEPILNPVWVALWAHETPGRATVIGGGIILTTVILHGLFGRRR